MIMRWPPYVRHRHAARSRSTAGVLAAGQALVIGLSWYQGRAYVALNADRDGLPDVQHLAEAIQPAATALGSLKE
jgi:hypothetical protein